MGAEEIPNVTPFPAASVPSKEQQFDSFYYPQQQGGIPAAYTQVPQPQQQFVTVIPPSFAVSYEDPIFSELDIAHMRLRTAYIQLKTAIMFSLMYVILAGVFLYEPFDFALWTLFICNLIGIVSSMAKSRVILYIHALCCVLVAFFLGYLWLLTFAFFLPSLMMWWGCIASIRCAKLHSVIRRLEQEEAL